MVAGKVKLLILRGCAGWVQHCGKASKGRVALCSHLSEARWAKSETLAIQSPSGLDVSPGVHSCISIAVVASGRWFSSTCTTRGSAYTACHRYAI